MMRGFLATPGWASLALCAACGSDPVTYSAPVGIHLKARSGNAGGGVVSDEKSINTESGNPYGAFISEARARIGRDPGIVDVERVELSLLAGSTGVSALGEVFGGSVDVLFQPSDAPRPYPVATGEVGDAASGGPVMFEVTFAADDVPDLDYVKLLLGSFKVITRGPAAPTFAGKGAEAELGVTLTFTAYE
jgi:hypothetical protein